jgi:hypothetical protein
MATYGDVYAVERDRNERWRIVRCLQLGIDPFRYHDPSVPRASLIRDAVGEINALTLMEKEIDAIDRANKERKVNRTGAPARS